MRIVVVAAGDPDEFGADPVGPGAVDVVIAADTGLHLAHALGLRADVLIGDMDSVSDDELRTAEAGGARVIRHPEAKDESDLELALLHAAETLTADDVAADVSERSIHVVVGAGGRLDHALANLGVLASPQWAPSTVTAAVGAARVRVIRPSDDPVELSLGEGDPLALVAIGGEATGVTTSGVVYPLAGERLDPFTARGISNRVTGPPATVRIDAGVLLAVSAPTPSIAPGAARGRAGG